MTPYIIKVVEIEWYDSVSGQSSIIFETSTGQSIRAFSDGYSFVVGEVTINVKFSCLDYDHIEFDEIFNANLEKQKKLVPTCEWDYHAFGQIVDIINHDAIADCGGIFIPIVNLTSDTRVIGSWVGFKIIRLEVEREDEDKSELA